MGDIKQLRQLIREKRRSIVGKAREEYSQKAALFAMQYIKQFSKIKSIGLFLPLQEEIDTQYLIQQLWAEKYRTYLPVTTDTRTLLWRQYTQESQLILDELGIKIPSDSEDDDMSFKPKLIVTPLVAYDDRGARIGMGGGFYDRTFASKNKNEAPYLMGFSYHCQNCARIEAQPWDIYLDAVANEQHLRIFNEE